MHSMRQGCEVPDLLREGILMDNPHDIYNAGIELAQDERLMSLAKRWKIKWHRHRATMEHVFGSYLIRAKNLREAMNKAVPLKIEDSEVAVVLKNISPSATRKELESAILSQSLPNQKAAFFNEYSRICYKRIYPFIKIIMELRTLHE